MERRPIRKWRYRKNHYRYPLKGLIRSLFSPISRIAKPSLRDMNDTSLNTGSQAHGAVIMCRSDPTKDPRPRRMSELCRALNIPVVFLSGKPTQATEENFSYAAKPPPKIPRKVRGLICNLLLAFPLPHPIWKSVLSWLHGTTLALNSEKAKWHFVSVHDIEMLPDAISLSNGAPVIFDARELYTKQNSQNFFFRWFVARNRNKICRDYFSKCSSITTVSNGLKADYEKVFKIDATVVRSVPDYRKLTALPVNAPKIRLVHHGIANSNRSLQELIKMVDRLDSRFSLDLFLTGDKRKIETLKELAESRPQVVIKPPISFTEIIPTLNQYDIGIIFYPPLNANLKYCLPNKFFEFIQARLAVAIGPSPDMASIVDEYNLGLITTDFSFENLANTLNNWSSEEISEAKKKSNEAAEHLCFEEEQTKIIEIFRSHDLLPQRS